MDRVVGVRIVRMSNVGGYGYRADTLVENEKEMPVKLRTPWLAS